VLEPHEDTRGVARGAGLNHHEKAMQRGETTKKVADRLVRRRKTYKGYNTAAAQAKANLAIQDGKDFLNQDAVTLRSLCFMRGLKPTGVKALLVKRLQTPDDSSAAKPIAQSSLGKTAHERKDEAKKRQGRRQRAAEEEARKKQREGGEGKLAEACNIQAIGNTAVEVEEAEESEEVKENNEYCEACGERDCGTLLCCDGRGCLNSYHVTCLGLSDVPSGDWLCPQCRMGVPPVEEQKTQEDKGKAKPVVSETNKRPRSSSPVAKKGADADIVCDSSSSEEDEGKTKPAVSETNKRPRSSKPVAKEGADAKKNKDSAKAPSGSDSTSSSPLNGRPLKSAKKNKDSAKAMSAAEVVTCPEPVPISDLMECVD